MIVYIDGKFVDEKDGKISIFDHGVLYGDGVFEGIRGYNGRIFYLDEHIERLYDSAKAIMLEIPLSKQEMREAIIKTVSMNNLKDCYIRVCVTRGVGDLGLDPRKCLKPTVFIIASHIQLYPEEVYRSGLRLITASVRRNLPDALNPCIKSMNYLNNILAKIEAINSNVDEALMLNKDGFVAECTGENIFIVKDEKVMTPPLAVGVLPGITRRIVIGLIVENLKLKVFEELFTQYHIYSASECFITGTACEIAPVVELDGRKIGDGRPGAITKKLIKLFKELTQTQGVEVYAL